jgi:hypothetical protein
MGLWDKLFGSDEPEAQNEPSDDGKNFYHPDNYPHYLEVSDLNYVDEDGKKFGFDYENPSQEYINVHSYVKWYISLPAPGGERHNYVQSSFSAHHNHSLSLTDAKSNIVHIVRRDALLDITREAWDAYMSYRPYVVGYGAERTETLNKLKALGTTDPFPPDSQPVSEATPESDIRIYKSAEHAFDGIVVAYGPFGVHGDLGRDVEIEDITAYDAGIVNPIGTENDPTTREDFLEVFKIEEGGVVQKEYWIAIHEESTVVMTPPQPEPPVATTHRLVVKTSQSPGNFIPEREFEASQHTGSSYASEILSASGITPETNTEELELDTDLTLLQEGLGQGMSWDYVLYNDKKGYIRNGGLRANDPNHHLSYEPVGTENKGSYYAPLANPGFTHDWTKKEINKAYYDKKSAKQCVSVETEHDSTGGTALKDRMLSARAAGLKMILESQDKHSDDETINKILEKHISAVSEDYYIDPRPGSKMRVFVTFQQKYIPPLTGRGEEEHPALICGTPEDRKRIVFDYKNYAELIDQGALVLESYAKEIDSFDGTVENGDLNKDAKNLRKVKGRISAIIRLNELSESSLTKIEIWSTKDSKTCFIGENSTGDFLKMKKGMSDFTDSTPMESPRIMTYLFFLEEMIEMKKGGLGWMDFLDTYASNPRPKVFPSLKKEKKPSSDSASKNTTADKLEKEIEKTTGTVKTVDQQLKEDKKINGDLTLKDVMLAEADKAKDFIGDDIIKRLPDTMRQVKNLEHLYDKILNKVSLGELQSALMKCFDTPTISAQFGDVGKLSIEFRLPNGNPRPPTVKFKKQKPLNHILQDFALKIADSILTSLTSSMINLVDDIVNDLFDLCDESAPPNKVNLNDLLDKILDDPSSAEVDATVSLNSDKAKLEALSSTGDFSDDLGIPIDFFGLQPQARQELLTDISETMSELSLLLEPIELCSMLNGTASDYTMALARSLIMRKSEILSVALDTKSKISDFFTTIGKFVGEDICNSLSNFPGQGGKPRIDCRDPFEAPEDLAGMMEDKGDGVTENQIEEQLKKARKRKKDKLRRMAEIGKIIAAHENGDVNPFENLIPDFLCNEGAESDFEEFFPNPSVDTHTEEDDFMAGLVMDNIFVGPYSAFINDVSYLNHSYTEEVTVKVEEDIIQTIQNPEDADHTIKIINPHLKALEAQGADISRIVYVDGTEGPKLSDSDKETFEREKIIKRSSESAKNTLIGLSSSNFESKYDYESVYYELILPPNSGVIDKFKAAMANLGNKAPTVAQPGEDSPAVDISLMEASLTDWVLRYKIPYQTTDTVGKIDDDYIIEMFPENNPEEILRILGRGEIDTGVRDFINTFITDGGATISINNPASYEVNLPGGSGGSDGSSSSDTTDGNNSCPPLISASEEMILAMNASDTISDEMIDGIKAMEDSERCKATLAVKESYSQDPDKYEAAWGKLEMVYNDYCSGKATGYLPPPQSVFGKYVGHIWRTALTENVNLGASDITALDTFISEIEKSYSEHAHSQISRDLLTVVNDEISSSKMFGFETENIGDEAYETPNISLLNIASRALQREELECGVSNHMLDIDGFKEEAKKNIKDKSCPVKNNMTTHDSDDGTREEIELSILEPAVKMTIRAYMIDYAVRGIFSLSQFKQQETAEISMVSFFIKKMLSELAEYSQEYADDFVDLSYNIYEKMKNDGKIEAEVYNPGVVEDKKHIGLQALMKQSIPAVHEDIQKVISRDLYPPEQEFEPLTTKDYLATMWLNNYTDRNEYPSDPRIKIATGWEAQPRSYYITMALMKHRVELAKEYILDPVHTWAYGENPAILDPTITSSQAIKSSSSIGNTQSLDQPQEVVLYGIPAYDFNIADDQYSYVYNLRGRFHISSWHRNRFFGLHPSVSSTNMFRTRSYNPRSKSSYQSDINSLTTIANAAASHEFNDSEINGMRFIHIPATSTYSWLSRTARGGADTEYLRTILTPRLQDIMVELINEDKRRGQEILKSTHGVEGGIHKINYANSNLLIEDMWVVKRKTDEQIEASLKEVVEPNSNNSSQRDALLTDFNTIWDSLFAPFTPSVSEKTIYVDFGGVRSLAETFVIKLRASQSSGAISQTTMESLVFEHFFEYISPTRRMVYSNPADSNTDSLIADLKSNSSVLNSRLNKLEAHKKSFKGRRDSLVQYQSGVETNILSVGSSYDYPTPLVDPSRSENYTPNAVWSSELKQKKIGATSPAYMIRIYNDNKNLIEQEFKDSKEFKLMFDFLFPTERYLSFLNMYSFMAVSTVEGVEQTFVSTKDELYKMFRILTDGAGTPRGGSTNLITMKNENVHQIAKGLAGESGSMPCPSFSFSGGFKPFKGIGFDVMMRLHIQAPYIVFKALIELIDPNIKMMKTFLALTRMAGACISPKILSLGLLPPTVFGLPPFGFGIGPPLTPLGFLYHALDFESKPIELNLLFGVDKETGAVDKKALGGKRSMTLSSELKSDDSCED